MYILVTSSRLKCMLTVIWGHSISALAPDIMCTYMSCLSGLCALCHVCLGCLSLLPTSNIASVLWTCISMYASCIPNHTVR